MKTTQMTLEEFNQSVSDQLGPAEELAGALKALWWDAKGDWQRAHELVQEDHHPNAAWVHAYLHRRDGDLSNAAYWYARAGKPVATGSFVTERDHIVSILLG